MMKVGLTGNIGSGKTTVSKLFAMLNVPVYHADERGKIFLNTPHTVSEIKKCFGDMYLDDHGLPDRKKLAALVFNDKDKLQRLNAMIHPQVRKDFADWAAAHTNHPYVMMEAAILFESRQEMNFHKIIVVTAPENVRIERVCKRDSVPAETVKKRMQNQMDQDAKVALADFVINNDGESLLIPQVDAINHKLLLLSQQGNKL